MRRRRETERDVIARFENFLAGQRGRIALTEICEATGVEERKLRACCQKHLGRSPMQYLRLRRMSLAREALQAANRSTTRVTDVATEHGFFELGRFSVQYRSLFGELPSATLNRPLT